ncbi:hypothetical protein [Olivibacter jilunii]|uniref:hypothetical protein n=1 Tax=Olivibacter jilunii TaxID=985016 RepID=UPI003F14DAC1
MTASSPSKKIMQMKKNLFFIGAFIALFYSCKKENNVQEEPRLAPPQTKSVAITDPNDVNLNVNWKWYDPAVQNVTLYFGQKVNNQPVPEVQASLPWFTAGNPANDVSKDYLPELGWTLYLRDFGTPDRPAQTPFFALYNKYSGVLRFFVYNFRVKNQGEDAKTYYVGELGFKNPSNYNELLSFFAPSEKSSMNTIDPSLKQIVVTQKAVSDTWINLDFTLNIRPNNYFNANEAEAAKKVLLLNVYGANQSDLNLGTDFSTLTAKSSVGASGNSVSGFADFVKNGYEYLNSGASLLESINKLQEKLNSSPQEQSQVTNKLANTTQTKFSNTGTAVGSAAIGTVAAAVGVVKGLFGFVKSFFGGTKSATNTQTTLQYSGIVNTTGTATTTNNLYSVEFNPNYTSGLSPGHYIPLYKQPIGVFGIPNQITLVLDQKRFPNCNNAKYDAYGGSLNTVSYLLNVDDLNAIKTSIQNSGTMRLDTVRLLLFNNTTIEQNASSSFNFISSGFINLNNGLSNLSRSLNWVEDYPRNQLPSQDNRNLGTLYSGKAAVPYNQALSDTPGRYPKYLGIELKYSIIAQNYPNSSSKERVIYKIIRVNPSLADSERIGCPIYPIDPVPNPWPVN